MGKALAPRPMESRQEERDGKGFDESRGRLRKGRKGEEREVDPTQPTNEKLDCFPGMFLIPVFEWEATEEARDNQRFSRVQKKKRTGGRKNEERTKLGAMGV